MSNEFSSLDCTTQSCIANKTNPEVAIALKHIKSHETANPSLATTLKALRQWIPRDTLGACRECTQCLG